MPSSILSPLFVFFNGILFFPRIEYLILQYIYTQSSEAKNDWKQSIRTQTIVSQYMDI